MNDSVAPAELLQELSALALEAASGAAALVQDYSTKHLRDVSTKSSPTDLVSEADRASEAHIVATLTGNRPDDTIIGEEGGTTEGTSGVTWVADPLDGTTNFVFGVPAYSVSLAARYRGATVVGVVVDPSRDETWAAVAGQGATCNGLPCRVAEGRSETTTALVATGFAYQPERRAEQAATLARLLPRVRDIRRFGSAALDLCWVAAGRFDAFYESHLNDWDMAAGGLICTEAGGIVTMLAGDVLLATTKGLANSLSALIATQ